MKRVVVKIGSRMIAEPGGGLVRDRVNALSSDVAALRARGTEVVIVSSGAIACGWPRLGLKARPKTLPELQAAAAAGQSVLMRAWEDAFAARSLVAAQVLLTHADVANRRRYLNARGAMSALLAMGAVPVVNENDTVAVAEIRYGDNDNLSADVASLVGADLLVLLTDIEGLMTADPRVDPSARLIETVDDLETQAAPVAGKAGAIGTGGMVTKVEAARKATQSGIAVVICDGRREGALLRAASGERIGTRFVPLAKEKRVAARKRWIAHTLKPEGTLVIDDGARAALERGKSLLPGGVRAIDGEFRRGAAVMLRDLGKKEIGRGLVAYDADDARKIAGRKSTEIERILGYTFGDELIHRDDLVLLG